MSRKPNLAIVVGTRPNLIKAAPLLRALEARGNAALLIHTGQHYDHRLSEVFIQQLRISAPDVTLGVGSGSHAVQTARIMEGMEAELLRRQEQDQAIQRLVVVGDVNSTLAAALAAAKLEIPIAHVEAGLRSFDRRMPEEINRIVTDAISDLFFVTEPSGVTNLLREGHPADRIHLVGNLMIDTLVEHLPQAKGLRVDETLGLSRKQFAVVTLHRPSNVDDSAHLGNLAAAIRFMAERLPIVWPLHPRTKARLAEFDLLGPLESEPKIRLLDPLGYLEMISLVEAAAVVMTDSGGLQEETTYLGVPCLTMRETTERPITVEQGSSKLVGRNTDHLRELFESVVRFDFEVGRCPSLWDGAAARRIASILDEGKRTNL